MSRLATGLTTIGLLWPTFAHANAGLPMLWVLWPFALGAIVPVIALEAWIVRRGTGAPWQVSIWEMSKANVISTLAGIPLTWVALVALEFLLAYLSIHVTHISDAYPPDWVGKVGGVVLSAPWLGPFRTGGHWIIPVATATLLVPFFFASVWIELLTVRKALGQYSKWRRTIWLANLLSYGILFLGSIIWLGVGLATDGAQQL